MTWKFIYTYREGCKTYLLIIDAKTGLLSHPSRLECISPNSGILFPKCQRWRLESLGVYRLWVVQLCGVYFCALFPSVGLKEWSRQALERLLLVSNFLTNFWMEHFDGARLSPNSVRNAVWRALNEPVCQYLRTRKPRCSTVYIDNSLGPLARDSPCIKTKLFQKMVLFFTLFLSTKLGLAH